MEDKKEFIEQVEQSIAADQFVKITLSKTYPKSSNLRNIYIRKIEIKNTIYLSFTYHYTTKDIIKNYTLVAAQTRLDLYLGKDFLMATLLTTAFDLVLLYNKKRKTKLQKRKASTTILPTLVHNKEKQYIIPKESLFLQHLGIANQEKIRAAHQDKFRQINKYVEIMSGLLEQANLSAPLQIVDMGCGKGYLTFALHQYLQQQKIENKVVGIELRQYLVDFCNQKAKELGWANLSFEAKDIFDYDNEKVDILIALHACDIATDIAIAKGIKANAQLIVTAPCCHRQIRQQFNCDNSLKPILKNGILEERQAEIVTDGIRALLLEAFGYQTKVFEFISSEHTAKNLLITAVKKSKNTTPIPNQEILQQVAAIKKDYGIKQHYLEGLIL